MHHLVYCIFNEIDSIPKGYIIDHIDANKTNNNVSNLEWCNNSENQLHAFKHGLQMNNFEHPQSKLNLEAVREE